jgi:hypothetical protein
MQNGSGGQFPEQAVIPVAPLLANHEDSISQSLHTVRESYAGDCLPGITLCSNNDSASAGRYVTGQV